MLADRDYVPPRPTINPVDVAKQYTTAERRAAVLRYRELCRAASDDPFDTRQQAELQKLSRILRRPLEMFERDRAAMSMIDNPINQHEPPDFSAVNKELAELEEREKELRRQLKEVQLARATARQKGNKWREVDYRYKCAVNDNKLLSQDVDEYVAQYERELKQAG